MCSGAECSGMLKQAMKVDTLPSGRQLTYGAYKDCSRPLRRCLKQLGKGSVEGGVVAIRSNSKALEEVAVMLDVEKQARCHSFGRSCASCCGQANEASCCGHCRWY